MFRGSHLLMAVGRKANIERLNLAPPGIETPSNGIKVDESLLTTNKRVYAIGDVAGGMQFTHVAGYHASVIIRSALFGLPSKAKTSHIPWATYTDPELAQVGLTEMQAHATAMASSSRWCGSTTATTTAPLPSAKRGLHQGDGRQGPPGGRHHRGPSGGRADRACGQWPSPTT